MYSNHQTKPSSQAALPKWFGNTRRRLTLIPVLFFVLLIVTLSFALHSFKTNKQLNELVRVINWQRQLKEHYILNLLNAGNGIPVETQELVTEMIKTMRIMEKGGLVLLPDSATPVILPPTKSRAVRDELHRKIRLYTELREEGKRLTRETAGTPAYKHHLLTFNVILNQIELPHKEILRIYTVAINRQLNRILWLELLTVLLACGLGVFLSILQKKSDQALEASEHRFRQIFEAGPLGKAIITLEGKILCVNPALLDLLGYSEAELLSKTVQSLTHPEDAEKERPLWIALLQGKSNSYELQKRYRHQSGRFIEALSSMALIHDSSGKAAYAIVLIQDTSERVNALAALQASEERYRKVIESASDGIIVANMDNIILSANSNAHHIFEYEPGELVGQQLLTIIPPIYREAHLNGMKRVRETHHSRLAGRVLEVEGLRKNGFIFPLELSLSAWETPEGEMLATAILRDVSERKMLQRERELLLQSNKNLAEFTLIASHDLQEPLRKIAFYTERFSNREGTHLSEESLLDIQRLFASVYRMQNLITDLLAYSRISPQNTHYAPVNLNQILEGLKVEMAEDLRQGEALIEIEELPVIEADEKQMRILLRNLLQNALKYRRPEVSPHIRIYGKLLDRLASQYVNSANAPVLELRIQDNGIGFDEKYLDRIFKVFQKLHSQTEYSGTGIGLATCRKIAEQHSGQITATSQPNEGSTFIVKLPIKQS